MVTEKEKISSVTVSILDESPLSIRVEESEAGYLLHASEMINDRYLKLKNQYKTDDKFLLIKMISLSIATELVTLQSMQNAASNQSVQKLMDKIDEIHRKITSL